MGRDGACGRYLSLTSYVEIHIDLYTLNTLTCICDKIAFLFVKGYKAGVLYQCRSYALYDENSCLHKACKEELGTITVTETSLV